MAHRRGPSDRDLERYLSRGFTHRQIAEDWNRRHPDREPVKPKSISSAISRAGLVAESVRYNVVIPEAWRPIRERHHITYEAQMLRAWERRLRGEKQKQDHRLGGKLDLFIGELEDNKWVIAYAPATVEGFHRIPRGEIPADWLHPQLPIVVPPITKQAIREYMGQAS